MTTSMQYFSSLEGAKVTLESPPELLETWQIVKKLGERTTASTERDIADGLGPGYAAGKFLCLSTSSKAQAKVAFMRIYKQIPIAGTEFQNATMRAAQAVEPREHAELTALKAFKEQDCDILGKQGEDDIDPGGYITYVVWEKVAGDSLDRQTFWSCPFSIRQELRAKFRQVYEKLVRFGYRPQFPGSSKIIYNWATGNMHMSGFRRTVRIDTNKKWDDRIYVNYTLA
ncbi:Major facilitator superfamily domain general substrate transporter [Penicillium expansum]|nr:Major facilitator superfamily domain general substrate transporter [Penicillium expansum]